MISYLKKCDNSRLLLFRWTSPEIEQTVVGILSQLLRQAEKKLPIFLRKELVTFRGHLTSNRQRERAL